MGSGISTINSRPRHNAWVVVARLEVVVTRTEAVGDGYVHPLFCPWLLALQALAAPRILRSHVHVPMDLPHIPTCTGELLETHPRGITISTGKIKLETWKRVVLRSAPSLTSCLATMPHLHPASRIGTSGLESSGVSSKKGMDFSQARKNTKNVERLVSVLQPWCGKLPTIEGSPVSKGVRAETSTCVKAQHIIAFLTESAM